MTTILGISASLRSSRMSSETDTLCEELKKLKKKDLSKYLVSQASILVKEFREAGRDSDLPYDEIYKTLLKNKSKSGLSNSETALAAALWAAYQEGCDIAHTSLGKYFPAKGNSMHLDKLREQVLRADAILLSGPVYFGDRGSLANEFIEFIKNDPKCRKHIQNKVYAGISSGAKRNGGQETTLIYQLLDMTNLNMLCVGNNSETTSQYGGTIVAGDVGTACDDEYGLGTSIGTGKRIAAISQMISASSKKKYQQKVKISVWLLQDEIGGHGNRFITNFCNKLESQIENVEFSIKDFTKEEVRRCIACDICPTHIDFPENYRCIIKSKSDLLANSHEDLIVQDAILLAAYSPVDTQNLQTVYQRFIERTRYLRRDDYVFSNVLAAPFVISEVSANQNLHLRMLTSLIRHHTVIHHPLIGVEYKGEVLNREELIRQGISFVENAKRLALGRLLVEPGKVSDTVYNPVGYVYSAFEAENEDRKAKQKTVLLEKEKKLSSLSDFVMENNEHD